jgi:hypothetical protein
LLRLSVNQIIRLLHFIVLLIAVIGCQSNLEKSEFSIAEPNQTAMSNDHILKRDSLSNLKAILIGSIDS